MPGETISSTPRCSSAQDSLRSECPDNSGSAATATTSTSYWSTAARMFISARPNRSGSGSSNASPRGRQWATTTYPSVGLSSRCRRSVVAWSLRPTTSTLRMHRPANRRLEICRCRTQRANIAAKQVIGTARTTKPRATWLFVAYDVTATTAVSATAARMIERNSSGPVPK
jgi:hypothetical protein